MKIQKESTGQAKVVLAISDGQRQLGAVTEVSATAERKESGRCQLSCVDGYFSKKTIRHYRKELLPILNDICRNCGICYFDIILSNQNLQAAAINDSHLEIDGFSADVSIFVAMLSAIFGIKTYEDIVFSGAISKGKILPVASLAVKLETAASCGIKKFYCARLNPEDPLAAIDAEELTAADNAVRRHRQHRDIQIKFMDDISDLFEQAFSDSQILIAAINAGAFDKGLVFEPKRPAERIVQKIFSMDKEEFRKCLSFLTMKEDFTNISLLWYRYLGSSISAGRYPTGCGQLLYEYMCSIPPHIKSSGRIKNPFISLGIFARLSQLAGKDNYDDLGLFFDSNRGRYLKPAKTVAAGDSDNENDVLDVCAVFDSVASSISLENLDKQFGTKIDSARASFVLPSATAENYDEFTDFTEAFYNHLCGFTSMKPAIKGSNGSQSAGVYRLIDRAFAHKGGFAEARCRAIDGSQGGLRVVLDEITEQFKRDIYTDQVNAAFKRAIDIKDDNEKKAFVVGALKRLHQFLPPRLANRGPEFLLGHTEMLAKIYVKAIDAIRHNMSRL